MGKENGRLWPVRINLWAIIFLPHLTTLLFFHQTYLYEGRTQMPASAVKKHLLLSSSSPPVRHHLGKSGKMRKTRVKRVNERERERVIEKEREREQLLLRSFVAFVEPQMPVADISHSLSLFFA